VNGLPMRHLLLSGILLAMMLIRPISGYSSNSPQQVASFLQAPYYGITSVSSIFDHDGNGGRILALTGAVAEANSCPCPDAPPGGCVDPDFTLGYYSCDIHGYLYYDNHRGIDYRLRYAYVRAAAPGDVAYAGWFDPDIHGGNPAAGYGLYVRLHHSNGYETRYGHMSVLRVHTNDEDICETGEFSCILGISGNTGWSSGPHLHFEVRNANGTPVDPYGPDRNPDHKLWIERPSIASHVIYTSGNRPLTAPPINENEPGTFTVDDGDTGFAGNPLGCWTADNTTGWAGDHRWRNVPAQNPGDCTATWNFPGTPGWYNVFVHIPNTHHTTDAAQYTVLHAYSPNLPQVKITNRACVNQAVYPNEHHPSPWVYIGTYYFNNQHGTDYVRLESQPLNPVTDTMIAADAVLFAPVRYRTYLPLVLKCYPAILPATPILNAIENGDHDGNYTVSWQPASGAETYTLQEATNPNFTAAITVYTGAGTSWTATNKPVGTYYYRVRATNCAGNSGWSNVRSTTVLPPTWFYVVADAMVLAGYPTTNYGSAEDMWAGYDTWLNPDGRNARGLVRFDLSVIPSGTSISQATLWLYLCRSYDVPDVSRVIVAYRVASSWTEGGVTWNTRPSLGGMYGGVSVPHADWRWYTIDVTDLVRSWVNGQYSNYGIWVLGNEDSGHPNWRGFCTREYSGGYGAWLQVTYSGTMGAAAPPGAPGVMPETFHSPLPLPEALPEIFRSPLPVPESSDGMPEMFRSPLLAPGR
jgi:murein DD-endopeptidase MepM/ murein hydrolase activator NlpD